MEEKITKITSLQNPKIKELVALRKAGTRKNGNLIIVEGSKEIGMAIRSGFGLVELYICPDIIKRSSEFAALTDKTVELSSLAFQKVSLREHPDGYLGLFKPKQYNFSDIKSPQQPLIIVLEAIEKPGNLGAILRTAEAADVSGVIVCDQQTDIYNPNVIRASLGAIFTVPTIVTTNEKALGYLKKNKIKTFAAIVDAKKYYTDINWTSSAAVIIGTEHDGLSDFWVKNADASIKIPMYGLIDSLNASVSAAITVYEAVRQRNLVDKRCRK